MLTSIVGVISLSYFSLRDLKSGEVHDLEFLTLGLVPLTLSALFSEVSLSLFLGYGVYCLLAGLVMVAVQRRFDSGWYGADVWAFTLLGLSSVSLNPLIVLGVFVLVTLGYVLGSRLWTEGGVRYIPVFFLTLTISTIATVL